MQARMWLVRGIPRPIPRGLFVLLLSTMLCATLLLLLPRAAHASTQAIAWEELQRGGYVILLRHAATVPGTGDPPGMNLKDCSTQRNLSEAGRAQAKRWGEKVSEFHVPISGVFTSEWCRCRDTANLAFGRASVWPALNSFFDSPQQEPRQTAAVRKRLPGMLQPGKNIVIVSHQVNITALTGIAPQMGEAIVAKFDANGAMEISGRLMVE
jgi:phosphohistidine phosphatase SixA